MGHFRFARAGVVLLTAAIAGAQGCATPIDSEVKSQAGAGGIAAPGGSAGASTAAGASSGGANAAGTAAGGGISSGGANAAGTTAGGGASSAGTSATGGSGGGGGKAGSSTGGAAGSAGSAGAAGSGGGGALLFSDDFETGAAKSWTTSGGTWAVTQDGSHVYAQQASGTGSSVLLSAAGSTTWTDQIIEVRVKVLSFGGSSSSYFAAIYGRFTGADYYALVLRSDGKLAIRKDKSTLGSAVDAGIVAGTWYTLRFEIVGTTLKAYVDGVLKDSETDATLSAGGIALGTINATAEFDDVRVTSP